MAINYAYHFAQIDLETKMCIQVITTSDPSHSELPGFIEIPVYDENYLLKYYIDGAWYEDASGTIPWTSDLM